jgi:hypothetical protein
MFAHVVQHGFDNNGGFAWITAVLYVCDPPRLDHFRR